MIEEDKNRQSSTNPSRVDQLRSLYHDLNNSWINVDWAFYMLSEQKLPTVERVQYEEMLSRNLTTLQSILGQLMSLLESREEAKFAVILELISQLQTQKSIDSLYQIRRLIKQLNRLINKGTVL